MDPLLEDSERLLSMVNFPVRPRASFETIAMSPVLRAFLVDIINAPELIISDAPVIKVTVPPLEITPAPAEINTEPPFVELVPACTATLPPKIEVVLPASKYIEPEWPPAPVNRLAAPVFRASAV